MKEPYRSLEGSLKGTLEGTLKGFRVPLRVSGFRVSFIIRVSGFRVLLKKGSVRHSVDVVDAVRGSGN